MVNEENSCHVYDSEWPTKRRRDVNLLRQSDLKLDGIFRNYLNTVDYIETTAQLKH